jgi:uncharacterized membrane protein YgcG
MAERLASRQLLTERRGANVAVFFLDPVSALDLDDECDRESVCHVHTLYGETMRYAIESSADMRARMRIDALIVASLKGVPNHVTAGVVPGNVFGRFESVITFFDDVSRESIVEQVDNALNQLVKKEKESFSSFTSRFKNIEFMMQQQGMVMDPALLLAKLSNAIMSSGDSDSKEAMRAVKLAVGVATGTAGQMLSAMAGPMRDREKERKEDNARTKTAQDRVNAAWTGRGGGGGGRGKGAAGRGNGGGKGGGGGAVGSCIKYAEGNCTRGDKCVFTHRDLSPAELSALKKVAEAKRASRNAAKSGTVKNGAAKNGAGKAKASVRRRRLRAQGRRQA